MSSVVEQEHSQKQKRNLKVTILLARLPTITESAFHAHWTHQHAKIVSPWLQKHGVIKYTQFHTPSTAQRKAQESISVLPKEKYEMSYDGAVELVLRDEGCFEEARKDPYYEQVVKPDEEKFIDATKSRMIFGWEEVYIDDGKVLDAAVDAACDKK